jgi:soluble lytic murein transglycosylase
MARTGEATAIRGLKTGIGRLSLAALRRGSKADIAASRQPRTHRRASSWLIAMAVVTLAGSEAVPAAQHNDISAHRSSVTQTRLHQRGATSDRKRSQAARRDRRNSAAHVGVPLPIARPAVLALPPDLAAMNEALELVRQGEPGEASKLALSIGDPVARKIVEWARLRQSDDEAGFERYVAFINANPYWPSIPLLRRRAEVKLWQDRRDGATVLRFLQEGPISSVGRLALARVLMSGGERAEAAREVRTVWRSAELSAELETAILSEFRDALESADYRVRMDRRIGAKDFGSAMRAAKHLGDGGVAIVKACAAVDAASSKGEALLDAVPSEARQDLGYELCRLHWMLQHDDIAAAARLVLAASLEDLQHQDTDEWWRQRRVLARRLIDLGNAETAYRVVREAAPPANPYYRAEFQFMAGWIALRFLSDPKRALEHFARVDDGMTDPIVRARASYWRGRAAEALGQFEPMRAEYEAAAQFPTTYYGQLARARLGLGEIALHDPPSEALNDDGRELVRAVSMLYAAGERDLAISFVADLAEESNDVAALAALGHLTASYADARAMLLLGKTALARGLALDNYAFPDIGIPDHDPVGLPLDRCVIYSIVRTESAFNQHDRSSANAVGLMQVTPEAGRDTAKRFGVAYDWDRLVTDPVYNTQMGAAEVAALLKEYRGSYIMTFAGYNAGRGRVRDWVAQHGDPRDPKVDAVDWVERIPFAETRNYVQRVMENLQVYRARLGANIVTVEPNLHRAMTAGSTWVEALP